MKYKTKSEVVEAVPYIFGLEDGFISGSQYIPADADKNFPQHMISTKYPRYLSCYDNDISDALNNPDTDWKPYIGTSDGMRIVKLTDMIITQIDGKKNICEKHIFDNNYEKIDTVVNIKYFDKDMIKLEKIIVGDWIDLRCVGAMKINIRNTISGYYSGLPILERESILIELKFKDGRLKTKDGFEDVKFIQYKRDDFLLLDLGIAMQLPEGYEANIVPRGSTFKTYSLIQTNHYAVIDEIFRGDNDRWFLPVLAMNDGFIIYNERVCQFRITEKMPEIIFVEKEKFDSEDRGSLCSTGTK